jgi:hypothetical protein
MRAAYKLLKMNVKKIHAKELLPRAAPWMLQLRLPPFRSLALRLADDKGAATYVFGFIELVVCHVDFILAYALTGMLL